MFKALKSKPIMSFFKRLFSPRRRRFDESSREWVTKRPIISEPIGMRTTAMYVPPSYIPRPEFYGPKRLSTYAPYMHPPHRIPPPPSRLPPLPPIRRRSSISSIIPEADEEGDIWYDAREYQGGAIRRRRTHSRRRRRRSSRYGRRH